MAVLGVRPRDVHEKVGLDHMVPAQGGDAVAPFPVDVQFFHFCSYPVNMVVKVFLVFHVGIHLVVARIDAEEKTVLVGELMVHLQVEVVEIIACPSGVLSVCDLALMFDHIVGQGCSNKVIIRAAEREVERGLSLDDGAFHVHFRGNQTQTDVAMVFIHVAILHAHVHHRGEPSAKTGREAAFIECDVLDGIGVERREEARRMVHVVERHAIE